LSLATVVGRRSHCHIAREFFATNGPAKKATAELLHVLTAKRRDGRADAIITVRTALARPRQHSPEPPC
jgi:hypothetical protein